MTMHPEERFKRTLPNEENESAHDEIIVPRRRKRDVLKQVSMRLFLSAHGYTTNAIRGIFLQRMNQAEDACQDEHTIDMQITESKKTRKHLWVPHTQDDADIQQRASG